MRKCLFFFSSLVCSTSRFFKFFEFASLSALLAGNDLAHKHYDAIHIESGLPRSFVFRAFLVGSGNCTKKEYLRERERERESKNALFVVFDEIDDENDDDDDDDDVLFDGPKGVFMRLVFFFFARKEEEDEEGGTIAHFFIRTRFRATSFFSLSFSLSLSLSLEHWN